MGMGVVGLAGGWVWRSQSWEGRFFRERWTEVLRPILPAPERPNPGEWNENAITMSWLGHATVLVNFFGFHILTDPALMHRVGLAFEVGVLGPKRFYAPALTVKELPPIDLILLSHAHMDHLDLPTLWKFKAPTQIITSRSTRDLLQSVPVGKVTELHWGEHTIVKAAVGELRVEALKVRHWGARWRYDNFRGYNGYLLSREGRHLCFGGDTAFCDEFASLRSKVRLDVAIMPIGCYHPWIDAHCTPEEAVRMMNDSGARHILPIHHRTFRLSDEPLGEPMERLENALAKEPERIATREMGQTFSLG